MKALYEIGRRLKWVKEHDLAHGEFGKWLESFQMDERQAQKFMKITSELPKTSTYTDLGQNALYLIATMPPDEREKPQQLDSGEVNTHSSVFQILRKLKLIEIIKRDVHFRHPLDT